MQVDNHKIWIIGVDPSLCDSQKKKKKRKKKKKNRQLVLVLNWTLHFDILGGRVLIAERFLDEDKIGPKSTILTSLNMLVQVDGKAKQLDSSEGSDAILCRKAWGNNMYYYTLDTVARTYEFMIKRTEVRINESMDSCMK